MKYLESQPTGESDWLLGYCGGLMAMIAGPKIISCENIAECPI